MTAVIASDSAQREFVSSNLGAHVSDIITGAGRVYLLYSLCRACADETFTDPIDGELLIECKFFDDEAAARQWVAADIALRAAPGRIH
jgi:hypothetical protein